MRRWHKLALLGALLAALTLPWLVQWRARAALHQEILALQQQVKALPPLQAEHERLSNLVVQTASGPKAPSTQAQELAGLRHTVGLLRRRTNELARLAAENVRASKALAELAKSAVGNTYGREAWAYAGYDKPENAVQTTLWASRAGDLRTLFQSATPAFQARLARELKESKEEFAESLKEMATEVKEYRITNASVISEDLVVLYVWFEYFEELKERKNEHGFGTPLYVKKVEGQWKLDDPQP